MAPDSSLPESERPRNEAPASMRDHLANERTLLAWIRTAVTFIGLGLLIDRLATEDQRTGLAAWAGIAMVAFGAVVALAGAYSYLVARRELDSGTYRPTVRLHLAIVAAVVVGGFALAAFLIASP
jgi:putative membrane protein